MKRNAGKTVQILRILSQWGCTLLFLYLFFQPVFTRNEHGPATEYFFYFDPLLLVNSLLLTKTFIFLFLLALIPFLMTLVLGRFFCGWICPLGSIHQFFSWMFFRFNQKTKGPDKRLLKIKYLVLIIILISAILGTNFTAWPDPFSLLTRSLAVFTPLVDPGHVSAQPFLIGGIFILILALNAYQTRFFCNVICPLGAMYGLISRFGLFRLKTGTSCNTCLKCSTHCTFDGNAGADFLKSECMLCFNCVVDCPTESVIVKFDFPKKDTITAVNPGRRKFFGSLALGATMAVLPDTSLSAKPGARHGWLRPPGARNESDFLEYCERCGACVQACPTGFIKPAALEAGVEGLWTPVVNAEYGYCAWNCNKCTQVCPSKAIEKLSLKEKQRFRIGTAVIDKNRCYTYSDGYNCTTCQERCPTPDKAIRFRVAEVWNYKGKRSVINQVYVDPDLCIGCGICGYVCPRKDTAAIYMVSEDEYRELIR